MSPPCDDIDEVKKVDNHAPPVSTFPKAPLSFKRIHGMSSPSKMFQFTSLSLAYPRIQQQFERFTYIGNPRIYAYFQLPEAFRRLLRPSSSLGA
ncbi:hypothetical protein JHK87_017786 [Glycine soja]|nr:hypothetical protein JHK87_017786 [Glycine soja]